MENEFARPRAQHGAALPCPACRQRSVAVGDDDTLGFGLFGQLDQTEVAAIVLKCGSAQLVLSVDPISGEVRVSSP